MSGPLVSVSWLAERLGDPGLVTADCRFSLEDPAAGERRYREGHIPGAVYFDLERDLSGPRGARGGRHPLPSPGALARVLGRAGIGPGKTVVAYDDQAGEFAARLWWLLRYLGHDRVFVLDGGFEAWRGAGLPEDREIPSPAPEVFEPRVRPEMVVDARYVEHLPPEAVLVDSRAPERYTGERETIDPVAGHIPGAVNRFWKEGLGADGRWLAPEAQRRRFADLLGAEEIVVYCGSGVTACANLLALESAGIRGAKLYAGSWSDWISDPSRPVATGREPGLKRVERKG